MKETSITLRDRSLRNTCRTLRGEKLQWARLHRQIVMRRALFPSSDCESRREEKRRGKKSYGSKNNSRKQIRGVEVLSRRRMEVFAKNISSMNSSMNSYIFYLHLLLISEV